MPTYEAGDKTDMGSLTDDTVTGRFRFSRRERVTLITINFSSGSGTADVVFYRHKYVDGIWGRELLWTETARGTGADVLLAIDPTDPRVPKWIFDGDHDLVMVWANPASGTMQWNAKVETELA